MAITNISNKVNPLIRGHLSAIVKVYSHMRCPLTRGSYKQRLYCYNAWSLEKDHVCGLCVLVPSDRVYIVSSMFKLCHIPLLATADILLVYSDISQAFKIGFLDCVSYFKVPDFSID